MFLLKTLQTALLSLATLMLYREHINCHLIITFCGCGSNDISIWISRYTKFKYQIGWAKWYRYNLKLCHESS